MRYQDLRRPRGAGALWLELRLLLSRSVAGRAPMGRVDSLSDHQLRDIGLDPRSVDDEPVPLWRIQR